MALLARCPFHGSGMESNREAGRKCDGRSESKPEEKSRGEIFKSQKLRMRRWYVVSEREVRDWDKLHLSERNWWLLLPSQPPQSRAEATIFSPFFFFFYTFITVDIPRWFELLAGRLVLNIFSVSVTLQENVSRGRNDSDAERRERSGVTEPARQGEGNKMNR